MKKIISMLLCLGMMFCLVACQTNSTTDTDTTPNTDITNNDSSTTTDETREPVVGLQFGQVEDLQKFEVAWGSVEYATMEITVKHGKKVVANQTVNTQEDGYVVLDVYYGRHQLSIVCKDANGKVVHKENQEVTLSADEYIIAPISGSMPQLYFTLYMKEITNNYTIPAFVWLARPDSWNWDNLPENVYPMPTAEMSEILKHNNYNKMVEHADAYIEELYSINKNSKFNLYINDYNAYLYLELLIANGIPEENYYLTLLSDGGASYSDFNEAFNSADPNFDADAKYDQMAANLQTLIQQVSKAKKYNPKKTVVDSNTFRQYSYVAAREKDNVEWWILRPREGVLCSPDKDFITRVLNDDKKEGVIEERNFANPLKGLSAEDEAALKSLYNFNNEIFEAADTQGKKAMMILGSWADAKSEPDFEAYVRFVKLNYGDEFVYYYKGHPNTPTSLYPDKQAQLEKLDLIDVESSINAELILFFYPNIYMCGYNSSTFMSVEKPEMATAMFNMKKAECTGEYKDLIGIYLSKIDVASSEYKSLCTNAKHSYFLMEYNDGSNNIGIYDDTDGTITKYAVEDGKFVEVK